MGEEVRLEPEAAAQLDRRPVRCGQLVDDGQADGVAQCGVARRPLAAPIRSVDDVHRVTLSLNTY